MAKIITNLGLMLVAVLLILACATTSVAPPPAGFVDTAIAETYSVAMSQTMQVQTLYAGTQSVTPTNTRVPSVTPLPTFTPVVFGNAEVRALADVACREGPGSVYKQVFILRKGQFADLVGRSADGHYLVIRNPNKTNQLCWVDASMVEINGFAGFAHVLTAPPTPKSTRTPTKVPRTRTPTPINNNTPAQAVRFHVLFDSMDTCPATSSWWANFELVNAGSVAFESITLILKDNTTGASPLVLDSEEFIRRIGCGSPDTANALPVSGSYIVSAPVLNYDPTGHDMEASIVLCSEPAHAGLCATKSIHFTP